LSTRRHSQRPCRESEDSVSGWPFAVVNEKTGKSMDIQKINVKFFIEKGADIPLASFIPIFHRWIQGDKLEGLMVDVAEYTHVYQGPGVLLIAHEANYSLDEENGKRGFLYSQKRTPAKNAGDHLKTAFRRALSACAMLEKEPELSGKIKFAPHHLQIFVNDRLEAPYNPESLGKLEEILNPFLGGLYDGGKYLMLHEKDPQKRAGFEIKVEKPADLETLLKKLSSN
jgi:hypothetical protein